MASQALFSHVVSSCLSEAVPTQLDRINEFSLGKVLIFSQRPRRFIPWSKKDLKFTGWSLSSLLQEADAKEMKIATASSFLFDTSKKTNTASVTIKLDADPTLREALVKTDSKLLTSETKQLDVSADFGKMTHISTDLIYSVATKKLHVKTDHPIIQEALATGGSLFVISTIYEAERCNVKVSSVGSSSEVFNRDQATPIAFLLLKLSIGSNGVLHPRLNTGILDIIASAVPIIVQGPPKEYQSDNPPAAVDPTTIAVQRIQSQESLEFHGWVVVNVASPDQGVQDGSQSVQPTLPTLSEESPVKEQLAASSLQDPSGIEGSKSIPDDDQPAAKAPITEEVQVQLVDDLSNAPMKISSYTTPTLESPSEFNADVPQLDEHYIYSLKNFQHFESNTYNGIFGEVQDWVKPLVSDKGLHSAYLSYVLPPRTADKLRTLSEYFQKYGNALRTHQPLPANTYPQLKPQLEAMSSEWAVKLNQVSSLLIVSEALLEFPQHIVKRAIELPHEKRQTLVDFIRSTPYGVDKHVYMDEGPFNDPDLYPIMSRLGFSVPAHTKSLVLQPIKDGNDDLLAAGLILLLGTQAN